MSVSITQCNERCCPPERSLHILIIIARSSQSLFSRCLVKAKHAKTMRCWDLSLKVFVAVCCDRNGNSCYTLCACAEVSRPHRSPGFRSRRGRLETASLAVMCLYLDCDLQPYDIVNRFVQILFEILCARARRDIYRSTVHT